MAKGIRIKVVNQSQRDVRKLARALLLLLEQQRSAAPSTSVPKKKAS